MNHYLNPLDWLALLWFVLCWLGYGTFSHYYSRTRVTLSVALKGVREQWLKALLQREQRVGDVTSLGVLQRNVTFFASTTMFILAGLLTTLGATDKVLKLVNHLPLLAHNSHAAWEIKLLLLVLIFVYAFFKFAWSVRQYNFAITMVGAAPSPTASGQEKQGFVLYTNKMLTTAIRSFSEGIRAYSYAMAVLAWFVDPLLFMLASIWVVAVLYRREFHSRSLNALSSLSRVLE